MDVHVDDVHLREALEDLPEQVVLELVVGLNVEFLEEVVLRLLICLVDSWVPSKGGSQLEQESRQVLDLNEPGTLTNILR